MDGHGRGAWCGGEKGGCQVRSLLSIDHAEKGGSRQQSTCVMLLTSRRQPASILSETKQGGWHELFLRPPRSVVGRPSTAVERSFLTCPDCESYTVRGPIAPELKT
jgi:hypothetical protein